MYKVIKFKLAELLEKKGYTDHLGRITWRKAAEDLGISHVALWKMVRNEKYNPSLEMLDRLCEFFKCGPGDVLEYRKPKQ